MSKQYPPETGLSHGVKFTPSASIYAGSLFSSSKKLNKKKNRIHLIMAKAGRRLWFKLSDL